MSKKYVAFHWVVHILFAHIAGYMISVSYSSYGYISIYLASYMAAVIIDMDHLPVLIKRGLKGLLDHSKPRRYAFHTMVVYGIVFLSLVASLYAGMPIAAVIFMSFLLHLSWDLFEDIFIFKSRNWTMWWM